MDPDGPEGTYLVRTRWTWYSHWIQTVLPDFGTNDYGIRLGDLESEDIRTFHYATHSDNIIQPLNREIQHDFGILPIAQSTPTTTTKSKWPIAHAKLLM